MSSHQRGHVHQILRQATAAAHHALDQHPLMHRLVGSDLTREQYAESLAAMYWPHARLERLVHESRHHSQSGLRLCPRVDLLQADLMELGWLDCPEPQIPDPVGGGRASWWGWVYVLEGSRQGSAVLARCIHSRLGGRAPCRFFAQATLPDNRGVVLATLERELQADDDLEQAAASARAAFATYQAGLDAFERESAISDRVGLPSAAAHRARGR